MLDGKLAEKDLKVAIRQVNQEMWDCGIRVSPVTRKLTECERLDPENAEFVLSLMDHRMVTGDAALYEKLAGQCVPKLLQRDYKTVMVKLLELTQARHAKYGETLFHLEPNIKDCPGGLRDDLVDGDVPGDMPDRHDRGFLAGVQLDQPASTSVTTQNSRS